MKGKLLLFTILSTFLITSCKKDERLQDALKVKKLTDVLVPKGFNWESSRDVNFRINITDTRFDDAVHVVAVYGPDGKLLSKGSASISVPFESKIYLPFTVSEVFVIKTSPDNSTVSEKISITGPNVIISLGAPASISATFSSKNKTVVVQDTNGQIDCSNNCDQSINLSTNNQSVIVQNGKTVCLSGSNKTFNLTFGSGGGTLKICGNNLNIQNINKNSSSSAIQIIITQSSSVTFNSLAFDKANHTFKNYGTAIFNSNLSSSGTLNNYGNLYISSDYNINTNNLSHTNDGILTVKGTMNINSNSDYSNNAFAIVQKLQLNNSAVLNNNCKLLITENLIIDKTLNNYAYILTGGSTQINGNGSLNLHNGSLFVTYDLDKVGGFITGTGAPSLAKVLGTINQNLILDASQSSNSQKVKGAVQLCYKSPLPEGLFKDGAVQGCELFIPQSGCNAGNGAVPVSDADGDGVNDSLDEYPDDASKAYNNYYPSGDANAGATVAFEDMWPVKGDYDMNDVVLSYQLKVITNAQNKVVQVDGTYNLYARGGIYQNGFGIEFPVSRSSISNVTGGILEEGQQKAVILLFSNMHNELYYMNTRPTEPTSPAKAYNISFTINNGPSLSDFGLGEYNPFIWNQAAGRGFEVHLPGKTPTSLANTALFGTGDDRSTPSTGKYYITAEGYPWAISIPIKSFGYPVEGKDIITAYLKLPEWISSGGTNYNDWYLNQSSDYRNTDNIFIK